MKNNSDIIEKLYNNQELSGEEVTFLARLLGENKNQDVPTSNEGLPYDHKAGKVEIAIGFKTSNDYQDFSIDQNAAFQKATKNMKCMSQRVEVAEKLFMSNTLARRCFIWQHIAKREF